MLCSGQGSPLISWILGAREVGRGQRGLGAPSSLCSPQASPIILHCQDPNLYL